MKEDELIPLVKIDKELCFSDIDESFTEELEMLAPFGASNSEPVFMVKDVEVVSSKILKDAHLKMSLRKDSKVFDAIGFNMADKLIANGQLADVAFSLSFNEWKGRRTIQLKVKDVRPAQSLPRLSGSPPTITGLPRCWG